jgi:hypothetical protein
MQKTAEQNPTPVAVASGPLRLLDIDMDCYANGRI